MKNAIRIGTRDSRLAVWQAELVQKSLEKLGHPSSLVFIKSEGDTDLNTPLYEMGVQGVFTRSLDAALLDGRIDIAVHSMKDVPTMLAAGIVKVAVLKRGSYKDLFIPHPAIEINDPFFTNDLVAPSLLDVEAGTSPRVVGTGSVRRRAQWLNRFPAHTIENLRGNVLTRLEKLSASGWDGIIMAAAGVERLGVRPSNAIELDWMLPAPAQGAIMVVARAEDPISAILAKLNDEATSTCTSVERDFLRALMGGCSTPISAVAEIEGKKLRFRGNILSPDGRMKVEIEKYSELDDIAGLGARMAGLILKDGGQEVLDSFT